MDGLLGVNNGDDDNTEDRYEAEKTDNKKSHRAYEGKKPCYRESKRYKIYSRRLEKNEKKVG